MVIASLFAIAKTQSTQMSINEGMDKPILGYTYNVYQPKKKEKKNNLLIYSATWMNLIIIIGEKSHAKIQNILYDSFYTQFYRMQNNL